MITFSLLSTIFAKIFAYVMQKTHSKPCQIGLGGNAADPYEGSFVPRAPGFNQVNSPNLYNDGSNPNASPVAPRIFKQEGNYHEEGGSGDIFSNPRLSSKISAAISSRFQLDQEDLSQETETDDILASSNTFIEEKNASDFVEPGSRIEPPITTFNNENLYDDDYDQASFAEIAEDEFSNDFYENDPKHLIPSVNHKKVVQTPPRKIFAKSARAKNEAQPGLDFDGVSQEFELPPLSLLTNPTNIQRHTLSDEALEENARLLESVLDDYGVQGEIVSVRPGPVVTMDELEPATGLKASRVIGLADDIAT